jgi:lincosamide nucleotidyltransferase A/C/D/E
MSSGSHMSARDTADLYRFLESVGVPVWIDGGWAVDALLGMQTRPHADLDIALETRLLSALRSALGTRGFASLPRDDERAWNFVLGTRAGVQVDVHAFTFDENGDGVYGPPENGDYYCADALSGIGTIDGRPVRCISPQWLVRFHTGYPLKEKDFHDVKALCQRFGIELPEEYRHVHE